MADGARLGGDEAAGEMASGGTAAGAEEVVAAEGDAAGAAAVEGGADDQCSRLGGRRGLPRRAGVEQNWRSRRNHMLCSN